MLIGPEVLPIDQGNPSPVAEESYSRIAPKAKKKSQKRGESDSFSIRAKFPKTTIQNQE